MESVSLPSLSSRPCGSSVVVLVSHAEIIQIKTASGTSLESEMKSANVDDDDDDDDDANAKLCVELLLLLLLHFLRFPAFSRG